MLGHAQIKKINIVQLHPYFSIRRKVLLNHCSLLVNITDLIQLIYLCLAVPGLCLRLQHMVYGSQLVSSYLVLSWVEHLEDYTQILFKKSLGMTVTPKLNRMHCSEQQPCFQDIVD